MATKIIFLTRYEKKLFPISNCLQNSFYTFALILPTKAFYFNFQMVLVLPGDLITKNSHETLEKKFYEEFLEQ